MRLLERLGKWWRDAWAGPQPVCMRCLRLTDRVLYEAGDYGLCSRCRRTITSETGVIVVEDKP